MKYLFNKWSNLIEKFRHKYIFLFFDYDGTLTPIVDNPDKAVISQEAKDLLNELSKNPWCKIAVISGRSLKDIKSKIGLKNIIYSGNHGLEIEGPRIKFESPIPSKYRTILDRIKENLNDRLRSIKGAFIEDKGLSLSLHYRLVNKKSMPLVKTIFHEAIIFGLIKDKIKIKSGKKVLEVRPPVNWDKGKVILWLLSRQKFSLGDKAIVPVYIGDDVTDEDAFHSFRNKGITIFVGKPTISRAKYYLNNTGEVIEFIRQVLDIINKNKGDLD